MAMSILYLYRNLVQAPTTERFCKWDGCIPAGCLFTCRMSVYLQDVCIHAECLYTCRMPVHLEDVGQWAQMGPGPNGPMGPTGPRPN